VRELSAWAQANFSRLDVGGDGVVCSYDLYRFAAGPVSPEDKQHATLLSAALADISRATSGSSPASAAQPALAAPAVVSREDLLAYPAKKAANWAGWLG